MQCSKGRNSSPSRMTSVLFLVWSLLVVASMAHAHDGNVVEVPKLKRSVLIVATYLTYLLRHGLAHCGTSIE